MPFFCWYDAEYTEQYLDLQKQFVDLNVHLNGQATDNINAKFLRLHPDLALVLDKDGLSLAADGMKMQPAWQDEIYRLQRANIKNELLARACQIKAGIRILDATAGLGHDSLLLAALGAEVTLIERHPIVFMLLQQAWQQAQQHSFLQSVSTRMHMVFASAEDYLTQLAPQQFEVIYLDPMFPQRDAHQKAAKKQAQVKKQMQLLHRLFATQPQTDLGDQLLNLAKAKAQRVIVKRPKHAQFLDEQMPQHQWQGDACRFDGYFQVI